LPGLAVDPLAEAGHAPHQLLCIVVVRIRAVQALGDADRERLAGGIVAEQIEERTEHQSAAAAIRVEAPAVDPLVGQRRGVERLEVLVEPAVAGEIQRGLQQVQIFGLLAFDPAACG